MSDPPTRQYSLFGSEVKRTAALPVVDLPAEAYSTVFTSYPHEMLEVHEWGHFIFRSSNVVTQPIMLLCRCNLA